MFLHQETAYVSVAHRYWNPRWSDPENRRVFGDQASSEGVGSNLRLDLGVHVEGGAAPDLTAAIAELKARCDHRSFFDDIADFPQTPSTLETVTQYLARGLFACKLTAPARWAWLTVGEGEALSCRVHPESAGLVEIRARVLNLQLCVHREVDADSGLALERAAGIRAVAKVAPRFMSPSSLTPSAWGKSLFNDLRPHVPGLRSLRIDLGSQDFLQVESEA